MYKSTYKRNKEKSFKKDIIDIVGGVFIGIGFMFAWYMYLIALR